jgi:hypothetical protein
VQLDEDILRNLLGGGPVLQEVVSEAENHSLVLADELLEVHAARHQRFGSQGICHAPGLSPSQVYTLEEGKGVQKVWDILSAGRLDGRRDREKRAVDAGTIVSG